MPYISRPERVPYQGILDEIAETVPKDQAKRPGHLNFLITSLLRRVYGPNMRYADHNEVMGVLNCVSQEFYRRFTSPYEDQKIEQEGDI